MERKKKVVVGDEEGRGREKVRLEVEKERSLKQTQNTCIFAKNMFSL